MAYTPTEQEWQTFYKYLLGATGLDLNQYKPGQLQRRIVTTIITKNYGTLADYAEMMRKDRAVVDDFLDRMAINVSELFRNPEKWIEMEQIVLPELLKRNNSLKIWSAGCSIGAEAHTLATILADKFPGNHKIICTDIDQAALAQARSGIYQSSEARGVPKHYLSKYFLETGDTYVAKPEIKKYLSIRTENLLQERFDKGFDLIMCRNVVIYFTDDAKDKLYRRFFESLKPGGILFVGSTERIFGAKDIGFDSKIAFFYQKTNSGVNEWQNAS